jgi:hypothetical protein
MPMRAAHWRLRRHAGEMAGHAVERPPSKHVIRNVIAGLMRAVHAHDGGLHGQLFEYMRQRTCFGVFLPLVDKPLHLIRNVLHFAPRL